MGKQKQGGKGGRKHGRNKEKCKRYWGASRSEKHHDTRARRKARKLEVARRSGVHTTRVALRRAIYEARQDGDFQRAQELHKQLHPARYRVVEPELTLEETDGAA